MKYKGQSIRVQKLQTGVQGPICIHRKDWQKVEKSAGVNAGVRLPEKTEEWLSLRESARMPGGQRAPIKATIRAISLAYDEARLGEQWVKYNGQSIRIQKLQAGTKQPICLHRDDWSKVERAASLEPSKRDGAFVDRLHSPTDEMDDQHRRGR